jgi:hypothetical protein
MLLVIIDGTLYLAAIIRFITLRTFEEHHFRHRQLRNSLFVLDFARLCLCPSLLYGPPLQRFPPHLIVHFELRHHLSIDGLVLHDSLTKRTLYALEREPLSANVGSSGHRFAAVLVHNVPTSEVHDGRGPECLSPTNRTPFVMLGQLLRGL